MDAAPPAAAGTAEPLQFDTVTAAPGAAAPTVCAGCKTQITDVYHMANDRVICSRCRTAVERGRNRDAFTSLAMASLLGVGAAIAGCAINALWMKLTHSEFALIAIVVGFLVGAAVRKGAGHGGWPYQILAVALTYVAIGLSYAPFALEAAQNGSSGLTGSAVYLVAIIGGLMYPMLSITSSPLSTFIIGVGLWQAWKQTRAVKLTFTGPYSVGQQRPMSFVAPTGG